MTVNDRRLFLGMCLATGAASTLPARAAQSERSDVPRKDATAPKVMPTYLVIYRHGPRWADGVPTRDQQGMREHFKYYLDLHRTGSLRQAGGFADDSGGAAVFEAVDDASAAAFVAADPAVTSGTFQYELKRWRPNPWEEISKQWAERGK